MAPLNGLNLQFRLQRKHLPLIGKHRDDAEMYAALRADELLAAGDTDGNRVWIRIGLAIRNLQERNASRS